MKTVSHALLVVLCLLVAQKTDGQIRPRFVSVLSIPNDARSLAMGGDALSSMEGPSFPFQQLRLESARSAILTASTRPLNWNVTDYFMAMGAKLFITIDSLFAVGAALSSYAMGNDIAYGDSTATFKGNVQEFQLYGSVFGRMVIHDHLSVAVTIKRYKAGNSPFVTYFPMTTVKEGRVLGKTMLLDVSLMKEIPLQDDGAGRMSALFLSASYTNIGDPIQYGSGISFPVPRSLHAGIAYHQNSPSETVSLVHIETNYRGIQNAPDTENSDFFRLGVEIGLRYNVILRGGLHMLPYSSIFGEKRTLIPTFGFGLVMNEENKMNVGDYSFQWDVGFIPIDKEIFPYLNIRNASFNYALSVTVVKKNW